MVLKKNFTLLIKIILLFLLSWGISISLSAQVSNTFDADEEGWAGRFISNGNPDLVITHHTTEGNPGGTISVSPPTAGGSNNTSMAWYWNAPADYFGDHDFSYGEHINFDLKASVETADNSQSDVIITGTNGRSIHCQLTQKPKTTWTSYSIILSTAAPWKLNSGGGRAAYKYEIKSVLVSIASIKIRCKYSNATGYTSFLDNVSLDTRTLDVAPQILSFAPAIALPGTNITITGTNFGATAATNIVSFLGQKATIVTASSTELVVTVPGGARLGPITVINTSNSLSATSAADFLPRTNADPDFIGRIIPSSFSANTVKYYGDFNDNGLAGADMGDIDNDGLLDIVAFEDGQRKFAIFLNQGQTGTISDASFGSKIEIPSGELGQGNSYGVLLADLDNDGKLDITTFNRGRDDDPIIGGGFAVSRNISTPGNIAFETAERFFEMGIFCSGLTAADLDGDGLKEILINSSGFKMARNISTPGHIDFATIRSVNGAGGAISTKDLNGDGKPEVVVVGTGYSIFENLSTPGKILLGTPVVFPGSVVSGVTLTDLDSDGKADITYYRIDGFNNYKLVIKKNIHTTGSLTLDSFSPDMTISTIGRAYSQCVADFNGDTKPDILIGYYPFSSGFVLFENVTEPGTLNSSSFLPEVYFEETAIGSFALPLIGDVDGDNRPDIVGFGSSDGGEHSLILYHNECVPPPLISVHTVAPLSAPVGSTVTITGEKFSAIPSNNKVWFGAVKGNVLTATPTQLTVEVPVGATYERVGVTRDHLTSRYHLPFSMSFPSSGVLDATAFLPPVTLPLTGANYDVEIGDMDNDGKPDIVGESQIITGIIRNYALTYKNLHTSGLLTTSSFVCDDTTNTSATDLRVFDIDEDGFLDIMGSEGIYRNISTTADIAYQTDIGSGVGPVASWTDFNLDGKTDAVSTFGAAARLYENLSRPGPFRSGFFGTFDAGVVIGKPATGGGIAVGDFDNDGLADVASSNPGTDNIRIWKNTGGRHVTTGIFTVVGDIPAGDNPGRLYVADIDVDGKLDFATYHNTGTNTGVVSVFHNTSTAGTITFDKVDYTIGFAGGVMAFGDLDGDGKPEMAVICEVAGRVTIFKNTTTPGVMDASSFAPPFYITITGPRGIAIGDLNGDSKPEIVLTRSGSQLTILENAIASGPVIIINPQPVPDVVCDGENATFTITASGDTGLTYQWQKFDGATFVNINNGGGYSGVTTSTLTITTTGNFGAGDYRCLVKGDIADDKFSNTVTLTVNAVPAAPTTTGETDCVPAALSLSASGGINGQYRWYDVATGGTASGQVNSTFTTPVISTTTTYHVSIHDGNCESLRTPVVATIAPLAKPTLTSSVPLVNGTVNICDGQNLTLTGPNGFDYDWSTGATTQQVTLSASSTVTLTVDDGDGCISPPSDPVTLIVNPYPAATISIDGTSLTASAGDSYQWYQNGDAVNGATSQSFQFNFLEYGVYAVEVTDNGCATTSDDFVYLITGTEPESSGVKIYPNPILDNLVIETPENVRATVIDPSGRTIKTVGLFKKTRNVIETTTFSAGYYILILQYPQGNKYYKLNKID